MVFCAEGGWFLPFLRDGGRRGWADPRIVSASRTPSWAIVGSPSRENEGVAGLMRCFPGVKIRTLRKAPEGSEGDRPFVQAVLATFLVSPAFCGGTRLASVWNRSTASSSLGS